MGIPGPSTRTRVTPAEVGPTDRRLDRAQGARSPGQGGGRGRHRRSAVPDPAESRRLAEHSYPQGPRNRWGAGRPPHRPVSGSGTGPRVPDITCGFRAVIEQQKPASWRSGRDEAARPSAQAASCAVGTAQRKKSSTHPALSRNQVIALRVAGPYTPSAAVPSLRCAALSAVSVAPPKSPSTVRPAL